MIQSVIADNVKRIMKEKGVRQGWVAERCGYTYTNFSNMMHGRKRVTDVDIMAICEALNVAPNELFKKEG